MNKIRTAQYWILINLLFLANCAKGQSDKSDLRIKVESIILNDIKYMVDSTTDKLTKITWDTSIHKGMPPAFSSLPYNPMTRIILGGEPIELDALDEHQLSDVNKINVYSKDDKTAMTLYGASAKNGLIIIQLKE